MSKKILFWIEPPLQEFGIANIIQKNTDSQMFAIIDTNKAKPFFENQKIVNFKKIWFYRDCFSKSHSKPNLEYLSSIEEKYGLNLWDIVFADAILYKYNEYYNFKSDEILSILEQECKFFEKILDEINPDALITRVTDTSNTRLLHLMCKARKIQIQMLGFPRIGGKLGIISKDQEYLDDDNETSDESFKYKTFDEIQTHASMTSRTRLSHTSGYRISKLDWIKAGIEYFASVLNPKFRGYWKNYGRTIPKVIKTELSNPLKRRWRENFLNNNSKREIPATQPFVYFALHYEPERTILVSAPFYTDQIEVISKILKSLPINFKLFVKEHPAQKILEWRNTDYYKKILSLPNVELFHPSISNVDLIKKSELVITIAGTAGFEAACYEKPSIVLSDMNYSSLPSVYRIKNIEDLPETINRALKTKVQLSDLNQFISKVYRNSFEYDEPALLMQICKSFFYDGFLFDRNIPVHTMEQFLKENNDVFETLGLEHIKKLNRISKPELESTHYSSEQK